MEGNDEDDTLNVLDFPNAGHLYCLSPFFLMKVDEQSAREPGGSDHDSRGHWDK